MDACASGYVICHTERCAQRDGAMWHRNTLRYKFFSCSHHAFCCGQRHALAPRPFVVASCCCATLVAVRPGPHAETRIARVRLIVPLFSHCTASRDARS
ncbi:hypothetical protein CC85DRAFT_55004 [Cutaneotrichosporon oleaginosum]|uniref:Uncharacterized protein n=1 Tax=Cutaneotrichosporon oleaginosum TaxID=879819 RepID=A0A0J0XYJ0_9TREE|nr:uncharacterized protein CC85DRAFT_55004 [Cutaneotrichosporon oleaginosum]KLT46120.1 hypothetical protein CC85DRAFT_55004 [Cutaneotrichosporon oleaginosum]TXT10132.1 hypothetical protein COLE_04066 [Cutaneotrichosporon oleaginosum]